MIEAAKVVVYRPEMIRNLCAKPYSNHPKGCPNYGQRDQCPPKSELFFDKYHKTPVYLIWTTFYLGEHVQCMKRKHPEWSHRQLYCCRYWQGTARKYHREEIAEFKKILPDFGVETCPEAMGINVTDTMAYNHQTLEWPPIIVTYQVSLAGMKR